jgi:hypothetical protein
VAHTHLKAWLAAIDQGHPRSEMGAVGLPHLQHPVDPGVDHLVAEGAEGGRAREGLQQGTGEEDLTAGLDLRSVPAPIEAGGAGQATIAPAKGHKGSAIADEGSLEVLTVELVKQGEERFEGQQPATGSDPGRMAAPVCRDFTGARLSPRRDIFGQTQALFILRASMDWELARGIGSKALLAGAGALLLFWTISAVKLVLSARGINPLIKQFFTQVASGQVDGAYLLTTKNYRSHVNRQQFIRFLAGLQLNKYRNLRSGRPRLQDDQVILTVKLKSDDKEELPLDFTFVKVDEAWRVDRIQKATAS